MMIYDDIVICRCRQSAPGQSECDAALENIEQWISHLDQVSLAAVSQSLSPQHDGNLAGFQQQLIASARQLQQQVEPIRHAAKGETGNLERYVRFTFRLSYVFSIHLTV